MPRLILGSTSPRRKELLETAGYEIAVVAPRPNAECGVCSRETPPEMVARLARQKAADVRQRLLSGEVNFPREQDREAIVIGCDTVAECAGQILGKPVDENHARTMLRLLSGRDHHTYSGLCLWPLDSAEPRVEVDRTTLRMDVLSEQQLDDYLRSGLWEGKAGAFGYQDRVGWLSITEGSESNVVGLPLELLERMLCELNAQRELPLNAQ